ncbi:Dihydroneopterin aldolase [Candidatus Rubidus massiliensis]|nr:Dihydroneopterin aldolase [Candidatus Rubidus massiliensis]
MKVGSIGFSELKIECTIGVHEAEKKEKQPLLIDLEVGADVDPATKEDDISKTIDYVVLADICKQLVEIKHYQLLETYAVDIIENILKTFPVYWVHVTIKKPQAIPNASYSMVRMSFQKPV